MNINRLKKKLNTLYLNRITVDEDEYSIILSGELDNYDDILRACKMAVNKKSGKHVVNNIKLKGYVKKEIRKPKINDKTLDGKTCDVLIIGGGISGCSILRELSKWNLDLLLVDKEFDLANQSSSRNDGEVHPGVDLNKGSIKQSYVVKGNRLYDKISKELDVPFKRIGQYACFTEWWMCIPLFLLMLERKWHCGIDDTKFVGRRKLRSLDSKLNKDFKWAIYNPMAGVVSPYELTIAYGENAVLNGAKISLNTIVEGMEVKNGLIKEVHTNRGTIFPKIVINCAGVFADDIAEMANDKFYSIHPRKGTISILDKKASYLINTISSIKKIEKNKTNSKGGGTLRTVHNNVLCGPDAIECLEKEDFSTNRESIDKVFNKQIYTVDGLDKRDIITYFTGVRASNFEEDYVLGQGKRTHNLIHVACIQSPGLTTAPAVALDIEKLTVSMLKDVKPNRNYNPIRKGIPHLNEMDLETRNEYIKKNKDYGEIICRCEEISKGEIIDALNSPIKVNSIDAIKRRLRPGMGRCQGTFCMPLIMKIIAEHEGIPMKDVLKSSIGTNIGVKESKGDNHE